MGLEESTLIGGDTFSEGHLMCPWRKAYRARTHTDTLANTPEIRDKHLREGYAGPVMVGT